MKGWKGREEEALEGKTHRYPHPTYLSTLTQHSFTPSIPSPTQTHRLQLLLPGHLYPSSSLVNNFKAGATAASITISTWPSSDASVIKHQSWLGEGAIR